MLGSQLPNYNGASVRLGRVEQSVLFGRLRDEITLLETAEMFLNVPYLWGGRSTHGIDCSGFTQGIARIHGLKIPRDASTQVNFGELVSHEDGQVGGLSFFMKENGLVHHIEILNSKDTILHASRWVREDKFDEKGIFREDFAAYTHQYHSIRRWFEK